MRVVDYLPSPLMFLLLKVLILKLVKTVSAKPILKNHFVRLVFKIMTDPFVGVLNFVRVYSGELNAGSYVYNARTGAKERVSRLLQNAC